MNLNSISTSQLSQFFRSIAYTFEADFLSIDTSQILFKRLGQLVELNLINENNFNAINHSLSKGQIDSKIWLINTINSLNLNLGLVYLCAGWYATLLLCPRFKFKKIRNIEICENSLKIANVIHKDLIVDNWRYLSIHNDIHSINFNLVQFDTLKTNGETQTLIETPDTIINSSCEHIANFSEWYNKLPQMRLLILQSNNGFEIEEHINAVKTLEEFELQTPMSKVLYSSSLKLHKFTRYMRIGYK